MTPGEVMNSVIADPRLDFHTRQDAVQLWSWIVGCVKPEGMNHMPLSPLEFERARLMLRVVLESVTATRATNPVHFRIVQEGER